MKKSNSITPNGENNDYRNYRQNQLSIGKWLTAKGRYAIDTINSWPFYIKMAGGAALLSLGVYGIKRGSKCIEYWFSTRQDIKKFDAQKTAEVCEYATKREADSNLEEAKTKNRIKEQANRSELKIQEYREKKKADDESYAHRSRVDIEKKKALHEIAREKPLITKPPKTKDSEKELAKFYKKFNARYQMPKLPAFLDTLMKMAPLGYEIAMLMFFMCTLGALCFSKARTVLEKGKLQAANFILVIIAPPGYGKGKFRQIYELVFKRILERDERLQRENGEKRIIQTISDGISYSAFFDQNAINDGVHMLKWNSELSGTMSAMKKSNGLPMEVYLKAFDNEPINQENKSKSSKQGSYDVFMNSVSTGTQDDCERLVAMDKNGGMASRIIFCDIPKPGAKLPELNLPSDEVIEETHDQIDVWRNQFCYHTDGDGNDVPAAECIFDLGYVKDALEKWQINQYKKAKKQQNSAREVGRIRAATNAFRCGMLAHIMFGSPTVDDVDARTNVVNLTLYIANYCVERYIFMFSANGMRPETTEINDIQRKRVSETIIAKWAELKQTGWSWGDISKEFGQDKDYVKTTTKRYMQRHGLR